MSVLVFIYGSIVWSRMAIVSTGYQLLKITSNSSHITSPTGNDFITQSHLDDIKSLPYVIEIRIEQKNFNGISLNLSNTHEATSVWNNQINSNCVQSSELSEIIETSMCQILVVLNDGADINNFVRLVSDLLPSRFHIESLH